MNRRCASPSLLVTALALGSLSCSGEPHAAKNRPNLLLVTIDTVRADRVGAYGYEGASTPVLDALAERGTLFEEAYSPAPMTLPVHASLMTGLLPPEHGARVNGMHRLDESLPTLAEYLREEGYRTGAFVAAFVLDSRFGLDRGFGVYDDDLSSAYEQEVEEGLSTYRPGNVVVDRALEWLQEEPDGRPFFAWVHLYDAHFPWHPHGDDVEDIHAETGTYDGEVTFVDEQVGRLVEYLRGQGLDQQTIVVALADHGEGLGDHHEIEHAYLLNHEVLHVPWIMAGPGIASGQRVQELVSLHDFQPTVLDLLGIERLSESPSLAPALRGEPIVASESYAETDLPWTAFRWGPQRSLTTTEWKYIRSPQPELYRRASDRGEFANLATAQEDVLRDMEARLQELENSFTTRESKVAEVDAAQLEQLAALGYAAGTESDVPDNWSQIADMKERFAAKDLATELRRATSLETASPEERVQMARRLVQLSPETPAFHGDLGQALVDAGARDQAIPSLERAVELAPTDPGAHYALGDALQQLGQTPEARKHLEMALELQPDMPSAHVGMGNVLRAEGRFDLAAGEYSEALRLSPDYAEAYYNLALTFTDREMPLKALENMELALEKKPGWSLAHHALARMYTELGRLEDSLEHYEAATQAFPRNAELLDDFGSVLLRLGRFDDGYQAFVRALEIAPNFFRPYLHLANLAFDFGREPIALERYKKAYQLAPNHPDTAARLARILAIANDPALRDPERALQLAEGVHHATSGRSPLYLDTLAAAYAASERFEDAVLAATDAKQRAIETGDPQLANAIAQRLTLYRSKRPFVVAPVATQADAPATPDTTPPAEQD